MRYKSLDYVFSLAHEEGIALINIAITKNSEDKLMMRWVVGGYEKIMSFSEFKKELGHNSENSKAYDTKTRAEILDDVKSILNKA